MIVKNIWNTSFIKKIKNKYAVAPDKSDLKYYMNYYCTNKWN